ncbi:hypothetical protein Golob_019475 [Gossypium lobatum]|uniref:Uncharacterized protein n=1 Tax=Gossypium lobatum TaxID=34289 RepID=A0A7J8L7P4_9ROSI|nr:hypothetical protein [Gossypium lobatum]
MALYLLTYKAVLEELCSEGKSNDAFELLKDWEKELPHFDEYLALSTLKGWVDFALAYYQQYGLFGIPLFISDRNKIRFPSVNRSEKVQFPCNQLRHRSLSLQSWLATRNPQ